MRFEGVDRGVGVGYCGEDGVEAGVSAYVEDNLSGSGELEEEREVVMFLVIGLVEELVGDTVVGACKIFETEPLEFHIEDSGDAPATFSVVDDTVARSDQFAYGSVNGGVISEIPKETHGMV